jgi:hypothetical protein
MFFSDAVDAFEKDQYVGCQVEGDKLLTLAGTEP